MKICGFMYDAATRHARSHSIRTIEAENGRCHATLRAAPVPT
jgi:hypothetical protein